MEVKKTYGSNAAARTVYAPSTSGSLAYAIEPAYRSTRLAEAQPQRKPVPNEVPAVPKRKPAVPKRKPAAAPKIKKERVPISQFLKENYVGTKLFILFCVGIAALMGLFMVFNFKTVSDTQCEINEASDAIEEMKLRLGEINMDYHFSLDDNAARLAAEKANMMIQNSIPGAER